MFKVTFFAGVILFNLVYSHEVLAKPTAWEIDNFKIIQQKPNVPRHAMHIEAQLQALRDQGKAKGLTTNQVNELQEYLHTVAVEYQNIGFNPPLIPQKTKNKAAFEIFYFDYTDKLPIAYYSYGRGGQSFLGIQYTHDPNVLGLDSSRAKVYLGHINPKVYDNLAHELFHAIQLSYPLFKDHPSLGDWITEGTATAIGQDIAVKYSKYRIIDKERGMRPYISPLRVPDLDIQSIAKKHTDQEGHSTSGLWRYIGEYASNGHKPSSKKKIKPDYQYLSRMFKKNIDRVGEDSELNWLDKFLRADRRIKAGLNRIYSSFISTFIHYSPDRFGGKNIANWHKCIFSGKDCKKGGTNAVKGLDDPCKEYTVSPNHVTVINIEINKTAARCFKIFLSGGTHSLAGGEVGFDYQSTNSNELKSIWIGTKIKKNRKTSFNVVPGSIPNYEGLLGGFASWRFEITKNPQIFVISNIATKPSNTPKEVILKLKAAMPSVTAN